MFRRNAHWLLPAVFVVAISSCDSGGFACSCMDGSMEPIPGGFPTEDLVENAAQARLTPHAITFLEENVDTLIGMFMPDGLDFPIDPTTQNIALVGDVDICHPSGCTAHAEILSMDIVPTPPDTLHAVAQVHFWIEGSMPLDIHFGLLCLCWDDCECAVEFDTARSGVPYNTLSLNVVFSIDPTTGYTAIDVGGAAIEDEIEDGDIDITNRNFCGLAVCNIANWLKGLLIDQMVTPLIDTLDETMAEITCMTCGDAGCPAGSTCSGTDPGDICIWDSSGECVPMLLGMESRMDVGSLLASISPGAEGIVDLAVVAGGYAQVTTDAVNLGVLGGLEALEHNTCVAIGPVPCEGDGDCASGFTCQQIDGEAEGVFDCLRCGGGCPAGSTESEKCLPDGPDDEDYNPTALCIDDATGECVRISYCVDPGGVLQASGPPPLDPVPVSTALQVDSFTHCVFCDVDEDCATDYLCSDGGVCTDSAGECQSVTEDVMAVVGISETFLRRAMYGFVDSGAACLEILPGLIPQLNTALFNLAAAPSLDNVAWGSQPMAMALKPEVSYYGDLRVELDRLSSPDVFIEDDPLLQIQLNNVTIDMFAWVEETYSRFETVTMDLTVGVGLEIRDNLITPVLRDPVVRDVRVTNKDLLEDDTAMLETLFGGVIELAMGFIPPFDPIEIPELEGFVLVVPDGGVAHVADGGEDFLALYAQLDFAPDGGGGSPGAGVDTDVEILESRIPPVDEQMGTAAQFARCERPTFHVRFDAAGGPEDGRPYEYRYRVDGSWWSEWSRNRTALISRRAFVFQGRHDLEVQARVAGDHRTEDPTPATATLLVDGLGPDIRFERVRDMLEVGVTDLVSPEESLRVAWRLAGDEAWQHLEPPFQVDLSALGLEDAVVQIEVVDEAGNVAYGEYAIRGRPPGTDDTSSCASCALAGEGGRGPLAGLALVLLALAGLRLGLGRRGGER